MPRHRKRRTFTITDESYDRMTVRADDLGTNRSRLLEEMIDADLCISLEANVLTELLAAADGEIWAGPLGAGACWSERSLRRRRVRWSFSSTPVT